MYLLNRMPTEGDILEVEDYIIEVVDIDKHIIDKILVQRKPKTGNDHRESIVFIKKRNRNF